MIDGYELDSIYLNESNNYEGKFTGLPSGTYSIVEKNTKDGIITTYDKSSVSLSDNNKIDTITITNTFVEGEGGDEEEDTPTTEDEVIVVPVVEETVKTGFNNSILIHALTLSLINILFIFILRKETTC